MCLSLGEEEGYQVAFTPEKRESRQKEVGCRAIEAQEVCV